MMEQNGSGPNDQYSLETDWGPLCRIHFSCVLLTGLVLCYWEMVCCMGVEGGSKEGESVHSSSQSVHLASVLCSGNVPMQVACECYLLLCDSSVTGNAPSQKADFRD